jgi:Restriction endonuclease XhoI
MDTLREDFELAVAAYWRTKDEQGVAAQKIRSTAEGTAKTVRGGGQFNPLINLISRFFTDAGYPLESVGVKRGQVTLPGFFRPNKQWDLVVVYREVLVAAIEMKALGAPSFGNNYNNRVEEAIGNSADIARAYREGFTGPEKPWLGYFYLMHDHPKSRSPVGIDQGPFPVEELWVGRSYQERYEIGAARLVEEGFYNSICYVLSSPEDPGPREPVVLLDWQHFCAGIKGRIEYLAALGYP